MFYSDYIVESCLGIVASLIDTLRAPYYTGPSLTLKWQFWENSKPKIRLLELEPIS